MRAADASAAEILARADLHVAPDGSDDGLGTSVDPFASLERALAAARAGDVVEVAAGEYPPQELWRPTREPGAPVVIRPAQGADVVLGGLRLDEVRDVEIRHVTTTGWYVGEGSARVTLREVHARGAGTFITSAEDVRVIGGSVGPVDSRDGLQIKGATDGRDPERILVDGLEIRDITRRGEPSNHVECVQVGGVVDLTIRNSRFHRCGTQGLFLRPFGGGSIRDVLIENNWVGEIQEGNSGVIVDEDVGPDAGIVVRNNSLIAGMRVEPASARVVGNIAMMQSFGCVDGVVYRHNLWSEAACDPTDRSGAPEFVDPAGFDLRLGPSSAAIDAGDPSDAPDADIDGIARRQGAAPDAGASEYVAG